MNEGKQDEGPGADLQGLAGHHQSHRGPPKQEIRVGPAQPDADPKRMPADRGRQADFRDCRRLRAPGPKQPGAGAFVRFPGLAQACQKSRPHDEQEQTAQQANRLLNLLRREQRAEPRRQQNDNRKLDKDVPGADPNAGMPVARSGGQRSGRDRAGNHHGRKGDADDRQKEADHAGIPFGCSTTGNSTTTEVPSPGLLRMRHLPPSKRARSRMPSNPKRFS